MMGEKGNTIIVLLVLALLVVRAVYAASPTPIVDFQESDSRRQLPEASSVKAEAGNVTELNINATVITKTWQGYYGNITGKVVLDNAQNKTLYDWDIANPEGEIYAANETITDWSSIRCFNYSAHAPELNLTSLENLLDCNGDADGVNETFISKTHPSFFVGTNQITANSCWATKSYVNDGTGQNFYEVLLLEPSSNVLVYTSIINASKTGFDNTPTDFQMLVGENGHASAASSTTNYYFYIELY